ncbi:hypothetical protein AWB69_04774 [Caballeronia udeis]|uniref:Uncharacterized protein n=1 Tax=Caballeronia udeis TaxID=1232866 RepID=A0A158HUK0_9BURK|nr:hypothetical protein AWB69_04774 [Caballeronia udeis]
MSTSSAGADQRSVSKDNADPAQATQTTQTIATTPATQATKPADAATQDSAVTISPEGAAMASQDASSGEGSAANVSAVKSLAYGTLGLERPDLPQQDRNEFYTAGRWIAAGLTIGGIISLLV